jgi:hypothetical protein
MSRSEACGQSLSIAPIHRGPLRKRARISTEPSSSCRDPMYRRRKKAFPHLGSRQSCSSVRNSSDLPWERSESASCAYRSRFSSRRSSSRGFTSTSGESEAECPSSDNSLSGVYCVEHPSTVHVKGPAWRCCAATSAQWSSRTVASNSPHEAQFLFPCACWAPRCFRPDDEDYG